MSMYPYKDSNGSISFMIQELCHLIKKGDLNNIKQIFSNYTKDEIDYHWKSVNFDYYSPIHEAAEAGQNNVLIYLISSAGFDINEVTSHGSHVIHLAAYRKRIETVRLLCDFYNISASIRTETSLCTPLILASRNGYLNIVKLLLNKYNVNINDSDYTGSTSLHRAAGWNQSHIVKYLILNTNANMEFKTNEDGYTPLMTAVYYNKSNIVRILIDLGANIEQISVDGSSVAHIAVDRNNYNSLYILIARGCNIDVVCKGYSVRGITQYGCNELKECVKNALIEYQIYYNNVLNALNNKLSEMFCKDIITLIIDMSYPEPNLSDYSIKNNKNNNNNNNKRSCDTFLNSNNGEDQDMIPFVPPSKKRKLR